MSSLLRPVATVSLLLALLVGLWVAVAVRGCEGLVVTQADAGAPCCMMEGAGALAGCCVACTGTTAQPAPKAMALRVADAALRRGFDLPAGVVVMPEVPPPRRRPTLTA